MAVLLSVCYGGGMKKRDWIDAKFEVIEQPRRKRRLFEGWWFDWRNFLLVGGLAAIAGLGRLMQDLLR